LAAEVIDAAQWTAVSLRSWLSYKCAYPNMVQCQILAEMEEIVEYQKLKGHTEADAGKHPTNHLDAEVTPNELLLDWCDRLGAGCRIDMDEQIPVMAVRSFVHGPANC
jgi:hypothetical protein